MAVTTEFFASSLTTAPHEFLQPSFPLHTDTLAYLKHALDPIAIDVSATQQQRLKEARKKRKRGLPVPDEDVLRLKQVHTEGFGIDQVWEQARRVIEATRKEVELGLQHANAKEVEDESEVDAGADEDEVEGESSVGEEGIDWEYDGDDVDGEIDESEAALNGETFHTEDEDEGDGLDGEDINMEDDYEDDDVANDEPAEEFVTDKFGLNDGFFSIDNFNKQSEFLEQQDARGDDDGAASDEDEVDWDANPLSLAGGANADDADMADGGMEEDDDDEGEEGGPTFGDPDAPSEDDEEELEGGDLDDIGGMGNTNDIMYAEFFAPPAQKKKKNKKGRPNPHNFPAKGPSDAVPEAEEDDDVERTMAAVQRDLFDDEESEHEEEEEEKLDPADPRSRKSTHERKRLALQEEIRKLEAANVAKREWVLSGEARAADRPMNSLLEEDLEFERAGKPVPVITAEVSENIEELIKRRILANDFQDIVRRRPDDLATGRRGRQDFELDNNKSKKSLAEEYEEEHLRETDPNYVDVKDEKLAKEQKEIEALWKDVCGKLDSLSSWHFRPKQPTAQLDIRVDAPTITMEDARPSAGGEVAGASQLAPQEIYKAGEAGRKEEVVGKSGLPSAREETSREDKKRRRRREKERIKKANTNEPEKKESKGAKEKREVVSDLKKGGVKIIGKKGEMKDVEGNKVREATAGVQGAAQYKL